MVQRDRAGAELAHWMRELRDRHGSQDDQEIVRLIRLSDPAASLSPSDVASVFDGGQLPLRSTVEAVARILGGPQAVADALEKWERQRGRYDGTAQEAPSGTVSSVTGGEFHGNVLQAHSIVYYESAATGSVAESPQEAPVRGRAPGRVGRARWWRVAAAAGISLVLAGAIGAGYRALSGNHAGAGVRKGGYQQLFRDRAVTLEDHFSFIDLATGQVVKGGRYWMLTTDAGGDGKGAFSLQDATDAYVSGAGPLTPAECTHGIARHPVTDEVHFARVPPGSWFCLRWKLTGDVAVLHLVGWHLGEFGATVELTYYHRRPPAATPSTVPTPGDPHYRALYAPRAVSLLDDDKSIDLASGRTVTDGAWPMSTDAGGDGKGAFVLPADSDASVAGRDPVTPAQCAEDTARHPVAKVPFPDVPAGTFFCVRSRMTGDVAVVDVLDKDDGDWTVTVAVTAYRPVGPAG